MPKEDRLSFFLSWIPSGSARPGRRLQPLRLPGSPPGRLAAFGGIAPPWAFPELSRPSGSRRLPAASPGSAPRWISSEDLTGLRAPRQDPPVWLRLQLLRFPGSPPGRLTASGGVAPPWAFPELSRPSGSRRPSAAPPDGSTPKISPASVRIRPSRLRLHLIRLPGSLAGHLAASGGVAPPWARQPPSWPPGSRRRDKKKEQKGPLFA